MNLSINDMIGLLNGLAQLDGYDKIVVEKKGEERAVRVGFTLSAQTKLAIALNRARLGDIVTKFNEQRNALLKELSAGNDTLSDPVKLTDFRTQEAEMLAHHEAVTLTPISSDDLRLDDENNHNIVPGILVMLRLVLSDFEGKKTKRSAPNEEKGVLPAPKRIRATPNPPVA
jgi:hypothetical protein